MGCLCGLGAFCLEWASHLGWGLLFALVTSCLGGGAFQLAEKFPVWSQGFLFELRLPVWTGAFHLSETSCLDFEPPVWAGAMGDATGGRGMEGISSPPVNMVEGIIPSSFSKKKYIFQTFIKITNILFQLFSK